MWLVDGQRPTVTAPEVTRPDVIVVGAGSAGCVVASRLSADPARQVLLLEAGPDHLDAGGVPVEPVGVRGPSMFDACAEPGRLWTDLWAEAVPGVARRPYARGRGVGGSSSVNAMVALPGVPEDYDTWERDFGCAGWGWATMGPALASLPVPRHTAPDREWGPVDRALLEAGQAWGAKPVPLTRTPQGERASAAAVYLDPVRERPNLTVRANCAVRRVLIEGGRATGVELVDGEVIDLAGPDGEVVLCAGAVHSPAVLWRSGVSLAGLGRGLADHASCGVTLQLREPVEATGLAVAVLAQVSLGDVDDALQLLPLNHLGPMAPGFASLALALMATHSRGHVEFPAAGSDSEPVLHLGLLTDERDVALMLQGVEILRQVLDHSAFRGLTSAMFLDDQGTPFDRLGDDADEVVSWLRSRTGDYVHATGTCRMGPRDDESTVVDTRCRVHGVAGLRVIDASVMPSLPRANTHLPTLAVAEVAVARW